METKELIKREYNVSGMTCGGCVATVTETLEKQDNISNVKIQLEYPQAIIESEGELDLNTINKELGKYTISTEKQEKELAPMPKIVKPTASKAETPSPSLPPHKT